MIDYTTVPAGSYVCRIDEVRTSTTRSGDDRWSLRLVVAAGLYEGRTAAWDAIVFSARGTPRAHRILENIGLPLDVKPGDLEGRTALVEVRPVEFETPDGEGILRNQVPYDGWRRVPDEGRAE